MNWRRTSTLALLAFGLTVQNSASVLASTLEIHFSGLDLVYDGADIYDATSALGGRGDPAKADPLASVTFILDGEVQETLLDDVWADVLIAGVTDIPVGGGFVTTDGNSDTFGFDLHTSAGGWGLALNLETAQIFYAGNEVAVGGAAVASSVTFQNLPIGHQFNELDEVILSFTSASLSDVTDDGEFLTGFRASGTGSMSGASMPEPSAVALLLFGAAGLLLCTRHRR